MPDRFVLRLSLFYGAFFVYLGLSMPFVPAWLAAKGLDAREIGIVLAAPMVVRVIVVPLATRLADRFGLLQRALIAAAVASVLGFGRLSRISSSLPSPLKLRGRPLPLPRMQSRSVSPSNW